MHIPTHILSGWVVANLLPIGRRERLFCMIAATIPDIDGLGIIVSEHWYTQFHHILGHNLLFGLIVSSVLAIMALS